MFAWYRESDACYVYLSDFRDTNLRPAEEGLQESRWFTRGWTLQELIAPPQVLFFDMDWNYFGSRRKYLE
jgi:hypothetical protein